MTNFEGWKSDGWVVNELKKLEKAWKWFEVGKLQGNSRNKHMHITKPQKTWVIGVSIFSECQGFKCERKPEA